MTAEQFIKGQIVSFAYKEAKHVGDSLDLMIAIAHVIRNRQRAGWFGGDWIEILHNYADAAAKIYPPHKTDLRDPNCKILMQQVDDIFNGLAPERLTFGALYYAELHRIDNTKFLANIVRDPEHHPRIANVGQVAFFQ